MRLAIILFNLGGPDSPDAVEPFLRNLFSDPAIIQLPAFIRLPLARLIARRRAPFARAIYAHIGGRSPILEQTQGQARALEAELSVDGVEAKAFVARVGALCEVAGRHFNRGQRAFFFALGYLGWFLGPWPLIVVTTAVVIVMWRRQFASDSLHAVIGD